MSVGSKPDGGGRTAPLGPLLTRSPRVRPRRGTWAAPLPPLTTTVPPPASEPWPAPPEVAPVSDEFEFASWVTGDPDSPKEDPTWPEAWDLGGASLEGFSLWFDEKPRDTNRGDVPEDTGTTSSGPESDAVRPREAAGRNARAARAEELARRLERIARTLRERGPEGPLAEQGTDVLGALITGYLLGVSDAAEGPEDFAED